MHNFQQNSLPTNMNNLKTNPTKTFQFIEKLGEGTYASVYKAFNKINDSLVAVKVFPRNIDEYAYLNEIEFLGKLSHPYIVKLYDVYSTAEEIWLVLEYCQLGSLYNVIKVTDQTLSEPEIAYVCHTILSALDYLHTQNKIHRDVKLANILVNSLGQVKLTDFGISSMNAQADSFLGSLLWMAPEMINGRNYDSSVDIWALGICVIEMAEGDAPFHHLHQVRAKFAIQKKPQTQFTEPSSFSPELNDFLSRCLQIEPENRMTASELLRHPFIMRYKGDLANIRKNFCLDRIPKIEDHKKHVITRGKDEDSKILDGDELMSARSQQQQNGMENLQYEGYENNSVIEHPSHISHDPNLTCIEKSGIEYEDGSVVYQHSGVYEGHHAPPAYSNLQFAIQYIQATKPDSPDIEKPIETTPVIMKQDNIGFNSTLPHARAFSVEERQLVSPILKVELPKKQGMYVGKHIQSSSENIETEGRDSRKETLESVGRTVSSPIRGKQKVLRPKMYKNTNESNFVVKHRFSETVLATNLNHSIDTETTLNPISLDRRRHENFDVHHGTGLIESINKKIPSTSIKDFSLSTAAQSKAGSTCFKSGLHTSNPSLVNKEPLYRTRDMLETKRDHGDRRNLSEIEDKGEIESERIRLEQMMKKELQDIEMKYKSMFRNLEKET